MPQKPLTERKGQHGAAVEWIARVIRMQVVIVVNVVSLSLSSSSLFAFVMSLRYGVVDEDAVICA